MILKLKISYTDPEPSNSPASEREMF